MRPSPRRGYADHRSNLRRPLPGQAAPFCNAGIARPWAQARAPLSRFPTKHPFELRFQRWICLGPFFPGALLQTGNESAPLAISSRDRLRWRRDLRKPFGKDAKRWSRSLAAAQFAENPLQGLRVKHVLYFLDTRVQ